MERVPESPTKSNVPVDYSDQEVNLELSEVTLVTDISLGFSHFASNLNDQQSFFGLHGVCCSRNKHHRLSNYPHEAYFGLFGLRPYVLLRRTAFTFSKIGSQRFILARICCGSHREPCRG
ncbi:hypothetical protein TNCV_2109751 [Trichonephila clavipes]|nr:hypothetical protein TNCV_2109751 [Trichonephila clavipes]